MYAILYCLAYVAMILAVAIVIKKILNYLKHPQHLRWELYPVAHEVNGRAAYGGSYLEEAAWWQKTPEHSIVGAIKGFLMEALFLHATYVHNRPLWLRTYPFHIGLYAVAGSLGLTILVVLISFVAPSIATLSFITGFIYLLNLVGFLGVFLGALALIQRRLSDAGLRKFSANEHFFNLGLFAIWAGFGLYLTVFSNLTVLSLAFFRGLMTFQFYPVGWSYSLYLLISFFIIVYIPSTFLAHFFMKFFTWHDIRWGDTPNMPGSKIEAKLLINLSKPVSWSAPHIQGDGKKTWAEVATTNPAKDKE